LFRTVYCSFCYEASQIDCQKLILVKKNMQIIFQGIDCLIDNKVFFSKILVVRLQEIMMKGVSASQEIVQIDQSTLKEKDSF